MQQLVFGQQSKLSFPSLDYPCTSETIRLVRNQAAQQLSVPMVRDDEFGIQMVLIPRGKFEMVSTQPRKTEPKNTLVELKKPFWISAHEITQEQFRSLMGRNPSNFCWEKRDWEFRDQTNKVVTDAERKDTRRHPVENVTWFDALAFCNRLSKAQGLPEYYLMRHVKFDRVDQILSAEVAINGGLGYRLPKETEWEFVCRAGSASRTPFGETYGPKEANVAVPDELVTSDYFGLGRPVAVGSYPSNAFDVFDMTGNVSEWCEDVVTKDYTPGDLREEYRVIYRGGDFDRFGDRLDSGYRTYWHPGDSGSSTGFRIARDVDPSP